jgi:hypothetical protein
VAAVVDAELSSLAVDEEAATEEEMGVDVAVLVAEAVVGVVEATDAVVVVLDADVVVDVSGVFEAVAEEVVEAASWATG